MQFRFFVAAVAASIFVVGIAVAPRIATLRRDASPTPPSKKDLIAAAAKRAPAPRALRAMSPKGEVALDVLVAQLQRRFHQRNNVDFGFSRVADEGQREHAGPTMDRLDYEEEFVPDSNTTTDDIGKPDPNASDAPLKGKLILKDGRTISYADYKETMTPENAHERSAIHTLSGSTNGIAIYTAGEFDDKGVPARLKGPAYFAQNVPSAPKAKTFQDSASCAWTTQAGHLVTPNGWVLRTVPVVANDASCVKCHNGEGAGYAESQTALRHKNPFKVGDRLGLILIAYRPR